MEVVSSQAFSLVPLTVGRSLGDTPIPVGPCSGCRCSCTLLKQGRWLSFLTCYLTPRCLMLSRDQLIYICIIWLNNLKTFLWNPKRFDSYDSYILLWQIKTWSNKYIWNMKRFKLSQKRPVKIQWLKCKPIFLWLIFSYWLCHQEPSKFWQSPS